MKRVLLIPHDDRPPNLQFPMLLGRIAGLQVTAPPRGLLGSRGSPGDPDEVSEWALSRANRCRAALLSLNFAACGGLTASRKDEVPTETALRRLDWLGRIRAASPECKLMAFGSITKSLRVREGREEHRQARRRNLECFERAVRLVASGVIDYLALGQDDARPGGEHSLEREAIAALAQETGVSDRVGIMCGTDETAMLLLARAANLFTGLGPQFKTDYFPLETSRLVPLFEDQPVSATISHHIASAGARMAHDPASADCLLTVLGPPGEQTDAFEHSRSSEMVSPHTRGMARFLDAMPHGGDRLVGVCDIVSANGGTPGLLDTLRGMAAHGRLCAYAGWNTSANTIGTAVAHLSALLTWKHHRPSLRQLIAHAEFLNARLLDDIVYQGVLRRTLVSIAGHEIDKRRLAARKVADEIEKTAMSKHSEHGVPGLGSLLLDRVELSWPWKRRFEIELRLRYRLGSGDGREPEETERMRG